MMMMLLPATIWAGNATTTELKYTTSAEQMNLQTAASLMRSEPKTGESTGETTCLPPRLYPHTSALNNVLQADPLTDTDETAIDDYKPSTRTLLRSVTTGVPLVIGGLIATPQKKSYRALRNDFLPQFRNHTDDYTQYLPAAVMLGMKAAGVKGRSSWGRMLLSDAFSAATMAGVVNAVKYSTRSLRPDTTDHRSFPSGHTATAFMTATMLVKEYGHLSPWVSIGAYTVAAGTGLMRMANNKHWVSDVMVGAGIGIISTEFGYWLADVIMKDKGLNKSAKKKNEDVIDKYRKPSFFALNVGVNVPLSDYLVNVDDIMQDPIKMKVSALLGLEGAYFFSPYIGVGGRFSVVDINLDLDEEYVSSCTSNYYHAMAGPYFNYPLSPRWSVGSKLLFGAVFYPTMMTYSVIQDAYDTPYEGSQGFCFGTGIDLKYQIEKHLMASIFANYDTQANNCALTKKYLHSLCFGVKAGISF